MKPEKTQRQIYEELLVPKKFCCVVKRNQNYFLVLKDDKDKIITEIDNNLIKNLKREIKSNYLNTRKNFLPKYQKLPMSAEDLNRSLEFKIIKDVAKKYIDIGCAIANDNVLLSIKNYLGKRIFFLEENYQDFYDKLKNN